MSFSSVVIGLFPVFDFIRAKPADVLVLVGWIGWLTGFDALAALSAGAFRVFLLQLGELPRDALNGNDILLADNIAQTVKLASHQFGHLPPLRKLGLQLPILLNRMRQDAKRMAATRRAIVR